MKTTIGEPHQGIHVTLHLRDIHGQEDQGGPIIPIGLGPSRVRVVMKGGLNGGGVERTVMKGADAERNAPESFQTEGGGAGGSPLPTR